MKKLIRLICAVCILSLFAGCGLITKTEDSDKKAASGVSKGEVILTVDGRDYSEDRFNFYLSNVQAELFYGAGFQSAQDVPADFWTQDVDGKTMLETLKENTLTRLTDDAVIYAKAKEMGLEITEDDKASIDEQITAIKGDQVTVDNFAGIGVSIDTLEAYLNDAFIMQKLYPALIENGEIKVDEAEATKNFKEQYVKAKHILISTVDPQTGAALSADQIAEAKTRAQTVLNKINAGDDFDALMNEYSEDPGLQTAPGGYVFTTGEMVPEFETATFELAENQVSGLVETSYGIHIIKRLPLDMNAEEEKGYLENFKMELGYPQFETLIKTWKSECDIKTNDEVLKTIEAFSTDKIFGPAQ